MARANTVAARRGMRLKEVMAKKGLAQLMAAHSPLSARLAEEAGFDGIWASGFEFSASLGLPDVSLVSMAEHLAMTRAIVERVALPVVADLDTGSGNAVNVLHVVREYERAGVAGVVIEDKTFPKVTSLVAGGRQELVRTEEFQGKIEAARSAREDKDLLIIARTEALIAGLGQAEALARAAAYEAAGADLILIHSRQRTPDEVVAFAKAYKGRVPLVIVPTAYPALTTDRVLALKNIKIVIYGNHAIRAAVAAMQDVFATILRDGGIHTLGDKIVPVEEIFRLQNMDEVKVNERRFLR